MKKEKHINKVKTKKGYSLRVIIKVDGTAKLFGTFNSTDYPTDKMCMEAARQCRDRALIDIRNNRVIQHDLTVQEAFEVVLELLVTNVKTTDRYKSLYKNMMPDHLKTKKMRDVTAADIQATVNAYAETHSADATARTAWLWRKLYRAMLLKGSPIADLSVTIILPKARKPKTTRKKFCTPDELEIFLTALLEYNGSNAKARKRNRDMYLAFRVMQYLGLRPQEAFALCSEDIDLRNDILIVQHSIGSTAHEKRQLIATKTEQSVRTLPIPDELIPYLEEMLQSKTRPLLVAADGLPYEIDKVSNTVSLLSGKKGVPKVTMYMMRHNFATDMAKKDVKLTQTLMGHESAVMSLHYADQADLDDMKEALSKRFS